MGQFRKLDKNGDTKTEWDPTKPDEVATAREVFTLYKSQGYAAARMDHERNDSAGEVIHEFDPDAGVILFIPQFQGG
jgi:hypothetical protein